jgi:hypothetical protein
MFIKSLQIGLIGFLLCAVTAWAGPSAIQGVVRDAKGKPVKGADIQIQSKDGKQMFSTVKTDAQGRYTSPGLAPNVYRVTLVINGAVKASITNTTTKADQPTKLNFDQKTTSASQANAGAKSGKHMVWMPPTTGSHTGGRWVEVDGGGNAGDGASNVKRASGDELRRSQLNSSATNGPPPTWSGSTSVGP